MSSHGARERIELLQAILRTDFYSFVRAAFPIVSGGAELLESWHIEAMSHFISEVMHGTNRRLIVSVPPRYLKSICASVCAPAFLLGREPSQRIICVSYSEQLARKHANDCRALMKSPFYTRLFPATRISHWKDTELEFSTTAGGYRLATSVGGTLTGRGGNVIIIDDPMKAQDAHSAVARESLRQWYGNTLISRLDSKVDGRIIVVMQRVHSDDFVATLLEQGGWEHLNLPAIAEIEQTIRLGRNRTHVRKPGDVLHPEREPRSALDDQKRNMGSGEFSAQYQQAPVPPGGNLIKWSWFRTYEEVPPRIPKDRIVVSWDTALSSSELADYSVCVVILVRAETVYVLDVVRSRFEYPHLKRKAKEIHQAWRRFANHYSLVIENKGSGMSLIQDLQRDDIHPIAIKPEGDKIMRMLAQTPAIEAGSVLLPKRAGWLQDFQQELMAFPAGRHNDQVDALSQALKVAKSWSPDMPLFGRYGTV